MTARPEYAATLEQLERLTLAELNDLRMLRLRSILAHVAGREAEERERVVGSNGEVRDE